MQIARHTVALFHDTPTDTPEKIERELAAVLG